MDKGGENEVFHDGKSSVIKLNNFEYAGDDLENFFIRINAHNKFFSNVPYQMIGFSYIAALFLAYVNVGAETMARMSDVPPEVVSIVQSVLIMFVVAEKFLANWKHKVIAKQSLKDLGRAEVR